MMSDDQQTTSNEQPPYEHPAFTRAKALKTPHLRAHFPKSPTEANLWNPTYRYRALHSRILAVAKTRITTEWCAYIDVVPGLQHTQEYIPVTEYGAKLDENLARYLFPEFDEVPYAD